MVISKIWTNCRSQMPREFLGVNVRFPAREGGCPPPVVVCEKASLKTTSEKFIATRDGALAGTSEEECGMLIASARPRVPRATALPCHKVGGGRRLLRWAPGPSPRLAPSHDRAAHTRHGWLAEAAEAAFTLCSRIGLYNFQGEF